MTIHEPATLITDYLLGAFTLVLARRLLRIGHGWWALAFAASGLAGFAGGTVHGFPDALGPAAPILWLTAIESLIVAAFAVLAASLAVVPLRPRARHGVRAGAALALAAYGLWTAGHPRFVFAIAAYGAALLVLAAVYLSSWRRDPVPARWIVGGVAVSALAAAVQQSGWGLHPSFNHNDVYHVIQAAGVWMLYRGAAAAPSRAAAWRSSAAGG